ncbi:hypothetical protein [Burkholderia sp. Ac-20344]|uniref:hypothetical protein n=1 Tax=Burkholderia sp. Ac-20344 TaxID=2703890 RepID=UPI00197B31D1|nr:hypothetical protein [Burkholderia sp. Ac-20344]
MKSFRDAIIDACWLIVRSSSAMSRRLPAIACTAGLNGVMWVARSACATCVLRVNSVCTIEMPIRLPMLRIRRQVAVPSARWVRRQRRERQRTQRHEHEPRPEALHHARPHDVRFANDGDHRASAASANADR